MDRQKAVKMMKLRQQAMIPESHTLIAPQHKFIFYQPTEVGDFLISCWGKHENRREYFGCSIYEEVFCCCLEGKVNHFSHFFFFFV